MAISHDLKHLNIVSGRCRRRAAVVCCRSAPRHPGLAAAASDGCARLVGAWPPATQGTLDAWRSRSPAG